MLVVFGVFSFCAVATGAIVCALSGVTTALWMLNLAGWVAGTLAAVLVAKAFRPAMLHVALWLAPFGLLASFFSPAQEGVHRWIDAGPLHFNAAMLLLPSASVALAVLAQRQIWIWIAPFASLILLLLQPDASQATTLAVVMVAIAAATSARPLLRVGIIVGAVALATLAWSRPDPLQPIPEVEGIVGLAYGLSPLLAVAALALLVLTAISADMVMRYHRLTSRTGAWVLSLCFLGWIATTYFGAFPTPWVGIGLSPIVGAWLGVGLLAGACRNGAARHSAKL